MKLNLKGEKWQKPTTLNLKVKGIVKNKPLSAFEEVQLL